MRDCGKIVVLVIQLLLSITKGNEKIIEVSEKST